MIEQAGECGGVKTDAALVDGELDRIQIGLEPRLQHEGAVDAFLQSVVALLQQAQLGGRRGDAVAGAGHIGGCIGGGGLGGAGGQGDAIGTGAVEALAVEDLEHAHEVAVLGLGHAHGQAADLDVAVQAGLQALPEVGTLGPLGEEVVQQGALGIAGGGAAESGKADPERRAQAHRFAQVAGAARALHLGQGLGLLRQRHGHRELAVEGIGFEVDGADGAIHLYAIDFPREAGTLGYEVAVDGGAGLGAACGVGGAARHADAADTQGVEAKKLAGIGHPVLVDVAPDLQGAPGEVGGVELAVGVGIQIGQGVEAVHGVLAIGLERVDAEELSAGVDGAVGVEVANEDGVVGADPARAGADGVGVVVEEDGAVGALEFQAITVEVEHQGVHGLAPSARLLVTSVARFTDSIWKPVIP